MNAKIITYLNFENTKVAIELYKEWLSAELVGKIMTHPDFPGKVFHARLNILGQEDLPLMMADFMPQDHLKLQDGATRTGFMITLDLKDTKQVDDLYHKGLALGGVSIMEPATTDWAQRFAMLTDKMGISWAFNVSYSE